jgi:hypothetical protein
MQHSRVVHQYVHLPARLFNFPESCIERRSIREVHMNRFDIKLGAAKRLGRSFTGLQVAGPEQDRIPNFGEPTSDSETYSTVRTSNKNCSFHKRSSEPSLYGCSRALIGRRSSMARYPSATWSMGRVKSKTFPGLIFPFKTTVVCFWVGELYPISHYAGLEMRSIGASP